MSKEPSGHFRMTKGYKQHYGSKAQLVLNVTHWAKEEADNLSNISKRQRDKFNTAAVVYDENTGKDYNGRNHGIEIDKDPKNPILFGDETRTGLLPEKSLNAYAIGNCAEIHAINKALNDGAELGNLKIYTIHTLKSNFGKPKPACENCTYALKNKIKENYSGWFEGDKQ